MSNLAKLLLSYLWLRSHHDAFKAAEIIDLPVLMELWKNWVTKEVLLERLDGFAIAVVN